MQPSEHQFPAKNLRGAPVILCLFAALGALPCNSLAAARPQQQIAWTEQERPILAAIKTLRSLPDDKRARTTKDLALQIRRLPAGMNKLRLANSLANLSTEGDFGHDTLQEVATTLAEALREHPLPATPKGPPAPYIELAELIRYEHADATLDDPQYSAAVSRLDNDDRRHQQADFSLSDLQGNAWSLKQLRGKVVLVMKN